MLIKKFLIKDFYQDLLFYNENLIFYWFFIKNINLKYILVKDLNISLISLKKNLKNNIPFMLDYIFINLNYLYINLKTYINTDNISIIIKKTANLYSIHSIYNNSLWLEREIKEFNSFFFFKLKDTRRLLLDYTINKEKLTYNNNNNIFYDIITI